MVAGTSNPAGASPSRPVVHQQGRVGCIVECDQPKGEQKGAYSLLPRQKNIFYWNSTIASIVGSNDIVPLLS